MSIERLKQLRKKSELILSSIDKSEIPIVRRSIPQMEKDLNSLNIKPTQELLAKAHYFLANNGIDVELANPIDTSRTFQLVQPENHTDIDKFLKEHAEMDLIEIIEEQRTVENFDSFYENKFSTFSNDKDLERMETEENMMDYKDFEKNNNSTGIIRIGDYSNVISALNSSRLIDTDYDLLPSLANICNVSELKKSQDNAYESWNILSHLVTKSDIQGRLEGRFLRNYTVYPYESSDATNVRRSLINASKSWLEQQSAQFINDVLIRNATKLKVGGIPSVTHRLRAFIGLIFKTSNGWNDSRLEIVEDLPIWAFIYLLIRSGNISTAATFIDTHREMFASDRKFVHYFEEYMKEPLHCVSKPTQKAILADFLKFYYGESVVDPYKILIYKIIGRCETHNKNYPDVIKTTEDYIWLQLMLVREFPDTERYPFDRYRLEDVQNDISKLGNKYFDSDETNPWIYFKILLLTNQFEEAINHLYKEKKLRLESVHFAIALYYCGLLKMPRLDEVHSNNILLMDDDNRPTLNFPRLIYQYVQVYTSNNINQAVQYLALITLYSSKKGYPTDEMVNLARSYICKFTLSNKDFKALLGSSDDKRAPGIIDSVKGLLNITTESEYSQYIINPIAEKCVQTGRCMDAVYVYALSGDYNTMVDVLTKELSDALQQPQSYRAADPTLSIMSNDEIIAFAINTMNHYDKIQHISDLIDNDRKNTVHILIQLLQFRVAYEKDEFEQALQIMEHTNVIPLGDNFSRVQYFSTQFDNLAETIKKNIPELLLNVMDILYKLWLKYSAEMENNGSMVIASILEDLEKKARTILTFTGLIKFSIPSDIIVRLNKVDTIMSARRRYTL